MSTETQIDHFPQTVIKLLKLHLFWPKDNAYFTLFDALKTYLVYSSTSWILFLTLIQLFSVYAGIIDADISENIVVVLEFTFFMHSLVTYLSKVNDVCDFIKMLGNFETYGVPRQLEAFKNHHNKFMKYIYAYAFAGTLSMAVVCYLQEASCEKYNTEHHLKNSCGFMMPIWLPSQLKQYYVKKIIFAVHVIQTAGIIAASLAGTYFLITIINMVVLHIQRLIEMLENVPDPRPTVQKQRIRLAVKYHVHIIKLVDQLNNCFASLNAGHYTLSSIIIGILCYLTITDFQPRQVIHLLGWLYTMSLLSNAGQKLIDQSLNISEVLYGLNWYEFDPDMKKSIRLMMLRAQEQLSVKTGILNVYSHGFLQNIMHASYTYMTMLKQLN